MRIVKDENGNPVSVPTQGQSTLNTVLGAVGTAGSLGIMSGLFGNGNNRNQPSRSENDGDRPVTRYEMSLMQENIRQAIEIAELKAKMNSDEKINNAVKSQMEFNAQQMVFNASANGMMAGLQEQTKQLQAMTKVVIPSVNVVDIKTAAVGASQTNQTQGS